jgi:CBS domain-containing protein
LNIEESMTVNVECIDTDSSVYDAIERMVDKRIRSLIIGPPDIGSGVITARDVVFKVLAKGISPKDTKVSDIASKPLVCIEKNAGLIEAATKMEESNVARIFVSDGEKLVGVLSMIDVMESALILRARGTNAV